MTPIVLTPSQNNLYIVTDSHLDQDMAPIKSLSPCCLRLKTREPWSVWGICSKYGWLFLSFGSPCIGRLWLLLSHYVAGGVVIIFVIGNREALLPRKWSEAWEKKFPFTHLIHDDCQVEWRARRYGFIHGDTINQQDLKHLRWRKIVRSRGFEWFFRAMPSPMARRVVNRLEQVLAQSNYKYKIGFPQKEVESFAREYLDEVDWYFVGHFHEDHQIRFLINEANCESFRIG